jgi:hypothetical protein
MIPKLTEAKHISGYRIWLKFEDGKEGEIDLEKELWGEIFEAVRDVQQFKEFRVDPELNTLTWPNGADFAPEYLYRQISA